MAVYTILEESALRRFLTEYDLGTLHHVTGIEEGIENSNFLLETRKGETEIRTILTLFERRVQPEDLPWFLGFMTHLSDQGFACPAPVRGRDGQALRHLADRPAVIVNFLSGRPVEMIDEAVCNAVGQSLARLHLAGRSYRPRRQNALGPEGWEPLLSGCTSDGEPGLATLIEEAWEALAEIKAAWPVDLPVGQIHADLFPDNVFFVRNEAEQREVGGVIDFYFACTDFLAYDLAICLNAWCFEEDKLFNPAYGEALIKGYESVRPLAENESKALPVLCRGAALRFLLTRLYDWVNTPKDAVVVRKSPWAYQNRLAYFRQNHDV